MQDFKVLVLAPSTLVVSKTNTLESPSMYDLDIYSVGLRFGLGFVHPLTWMEGALFGFLCDQGLRRTPHQGERS
jgi:hypothetical protein